MGSLTRDSNSNGCQSFSSGSSSFAPYIRYVKSGPVASRCSNDCIYEKVEMPGKYFCFAPGDLHVECEDDEVTEAPGGELTVQFPSLYCRVTFTSLSSLSVSHWVIESVRYKLVNSS